MDSGNSEFSYPILGFSLIAAMSVGTSTYPILERLEPVFQPKNVACKYFTEGETNLFMARSVLFNWEYKFVVTDSN